jgi:HprK-related kinase A
VNVRQLSPGELHRRLRSGNLCVRTGPFLCQFESPFRDVAELVAFGYPDFPLADDSRFADFHVRVVPQNGLRRWCRRQVVFRMDDWSPVEPYPRALAAPLLEWGLNWCVAAHANQYLIIHAAVVERDGRAVLLPATSGAGKSTLCAGLVLHGWRLLSDELALIRPDDGRLVPLPRLVSLKNESIEVIRGFSPRARVGRSWGGTAKGTVAHLRPPTESVQQADELASPAWVVFPRFEPNSPTRSRRCPKGTAFMELARHAVNYSLLGQRGFETMSRLVDGCDCYEFRYSNLHGAVARFDALPLPANPHIGQAVP